MNLTTSLSLGKFREEISDLKPLVLTRDEPLEPLSISMQADSITIVLGASPYIALRSGNTSICLSHIQTVRRSTYHGKNAFRIVCGDYTASNDPQPIGYLLTFPN